MLAICTTMCIFFDLMIFEFLFNGLKNRNIRRMWGAPLSLRKAVKAQSAKGSQ